MNDRPSFQVIQGERIDNVVVDEVRPPEFSDECLALRFADLHANDLRFVDMWGKWLLWDGHRWAADETRRAFDFAREVCRAASAECNTKAAAQIASAKTVAAVHRLAQSDRRLAATLEQWDSDPWLLNTPRGVIDLRSGKTREGVPEDYMTKMTAVPGGRDCPRFLTFIDEITGGDTDLRTFLQRMLGYSLTGSTQEHALFFLYGTGANGKSVFVNTVTGILGDYHRTAPIETFTASNVERHPTELASLQGRRIVSAIETEEGRRWAESRIKALTGGDKIAARFMRQDFFEFTPQFKLIIAGNHKPGLRTVDEAIRRRFHLVPFTVTILPKDRDPSLTEKLRLEWPGILEWMIEGALDWQQQGLRPPEAVTAATKAYLEAEDALTAWLDECCDRSNASAWTKTAALFASWRTWAERAGEHPGTMKRFVQNLETRGLTYERKAQPRLRRNHSRNPRPAGQMVGTVSNPRMAENPRNDACDVSSYFQRSRARYAPNGSWGHTRHRAEICGICEDKNASLIAASPPLWADRITTASGQFWALRGILSLLWLPQHDRARRGVLRFLAHRPELSNDLSHIFL